MAGGLTADLAQGPADTESLFRSLFDADIIGVVIADGERVVEANDAFLRVVGATRAEVLAGRLRWTGTAPPEHAGAGPWEIEHVRRDGSRVPLLVGAATVNRTPRRSVSFVLDLSERRRAMERVTRLHALASALSAAPSADEVADAILRHGAETTGASCAVLGLVEGRDLVLAHRHRFGDAGAAPARVPAAAEAPMPEAIRSGRPVLLGSRDAWLRRFPALLPSGDFEAFAAVPVVGEHGAVGCMGFGFPDRRAFDNADVELLQVIARQGAQALERAALYEQRAHVARTLQHALLPAELPEVPGLQIAAAYQPLGAGDEVGGDFYDVFPTDAGWTAAIGDVCGKGVEAAVVTGTVRHTLRALELAHGEPAAVLRRLNQAVRRHAPDSRFCSVALAHLTALREGFRVDLACAGHPPALVLRAGGELEELGACGSLLGIDDEMHLVATTSELRSGDALV
ncbi:MAG TPA: SpoIIE family protein phosphatase, partial [Solirubrobacteraceae bacterium]